MAITSFNHADDSSSREDRAKTWKEPISLNNCGTEQPASGIFTLDCHMKERNILSFKLPHGWISLNNLAFCPEIEMILRSDQKSIPQVPPTSLPVLKISHSILQKAKPLPRPRAMIPLASKILPQGSSSLRAPAMPSASLEEIAALILWLQTRVLRLWCGVTFLPTLQSREPVSPTKRPARNCESRVMKCVETASMPIAFRFKCEKKTVTLIN